METNSQSAKILILGAGGAAGILLTRCLKDHFDVYGTDDGEFARHLIEAKKTDTSSNHYDLHIPVPDSLIPKLKESDACTFLPAMEEIQLCQDKAKSAEALGGLAPKTYWVRDTKGAGGKGAQMCSEYLPGKNLGTELLYDNGTLYAYFQKERVSYSAKSRSSDVTGSAMVATCIKNTALLKLAIKAVSKISNKPHGVYSVDFRENESGEPKVTEINAGRFVTSSYIFYYKTAYNLPKLMVELALNLPKTHLGEYPEGLTIIRQVDREPCLTNL